MDYKISISEVANADINDLADYISLKLFAPESAEKHVKLIYEAIVNLADFPRRYPKFSAHFLPHFEVRIMPVKNYSVFYSIGEQNIYVLRVLYNKREPQGLL